MKLFGIPVGLLSVLGTQVQADPNACGSNICKATQHCDKAQGICVKAEEFCATPCASNEFCGFDGMCRPYSCANWYYYSSWRLVEQNASPMECQVEQDPHIWQTIYACPANPSQGPKLFSNYKCTSMVGTYTFHCSSVGQDDAELQSMLTDYQAEVEASKANEAPCVDVDNNPLERSFIYLATYDHPDQKAPITVDLDGEEQGTATLQSQLVQQTIFTELLVPKETQAPSEETTSGADRSLLSNVALLGVAVGITGFL